MRLLFLLLFVFLFSQANAQTIRPVYTMSNTSVTVNCDSWIVDPDSLRGNYPAGVTTMVVTSANGSQIGVHLDSLYLKQDQDFVNIFDGPTTSSPLVATYTRSSWNNPGFKSTGSALTIQFYGHGTPPAIPKAGWRLKLSCVSPITNPTDFTPIFQGMEYGNIKLSDYDKDGDKDVLIGGRIWRNDSKDDSLYVFERLLKPLGDWKSSSMAAADLDNDGFKDVFIVGEKMNTPGPGITRSAVLYKNVNGNFTPVSGLSFPGVSDGTVSLFDFNNDGKTDIAYTGTNGSANIFKLYLNNGSLSFTEKVLNIPGKTYSSMAWKDYDNDGDQDLLYSGYPTDPTAGTGIYINNANTSFTYYPMVMFNRYWGEIKWVDVNNDGRYDIVSTGIGSSGTGEPPEILFNNGSNNFTRVVTTLPALSYSYQHWADYDGDGDQDLLLTGFQISPTIDYTPAIYKNTGNGTFVKKPFYNLGSTSSARWIQLNNDGKWDVFLPGRGIYPGLAFKNMGLDSFAAVSYPFTGYESTGTALAEDFDNNGVTDFLFAGSLADQDCNEGYSSAMIKGLGWKVFPTARLTLVADLNRNFNWTTGSQRWFEYWSWGDVDSDGNDDILLTNDPSVMNGIIDSAWIFKNNGNSNFSVLYKGILTPNQYNVQIAVVDIDNDGVNELYVTPNRLYRWNGTGLTLLYSEPLSNCFSACNYTFYGLADFDRDGYIDLAHSGGNMVHILRNNRNGRFVDINGGFSMASNDKFLKWHDFDSDGDADLLLTNWILESTPTGFRYREVDIPRHGHSGIGDFNKDGSPDIFILPHLDMIGNSKLFYGQQNKLFFEDKTPTPFIQLNNGVYFEGAEAFDIDSDGDDDLIYSTRSGCSYSGVYINNLNMRTANVVVRTPNGNEQYQVGSTQIIKWIGNDISPSVKIELSLDSGITWSVITLNAASGKFDGNFSWNTTGVSPSNKALIRITDNATSSIVDKSDKTFRLTISTAIRNLQQENDTRVYPNPVSKTLVVESRTFRPGKKVKALIYTSAGILVAGKEIAFSGGKTTIYLGDLPAGLYFVNISDDKKTEVHKLVKL